MLLNLRRVLQISIKISSQNAIIYIIAITKSVQVYLTL